MEDGVPSIDEVFRPVIGLPCWNVRQGHGSFLTLEFGEPKLEIREPREAPDGSPRVRELLARRRVSVHGQWHLWIYCCGWWIHQLREELACYKSAEDRIAAACERLDGQALRKVAVGPKTGGARLLFDLGGVLTTEPYDDELNEQWMLYCPDGNVYTRRSDGAASLGPKDQKQHEEVWTING